MNVRTTHHWCGNGADSSSNDQDICFKCDKNGGGNLDINRPFHCLSSVYHAKLWPGKHAHISPIRFIANSLVSCSRALTTPPFLPQFFAVS